MAGIVIERGMRLAELRGTEPRDMFLKRDLFRAEFEAGLLLYKLTGADTVVGSTVSVGRGGYVTPWWLSYEPVHAGGSTRMTIPGVHDVVRASQRAGSDVSQLLRSHAAVNMAWRNPMSHLLVVQLVRPVVGLLGRASAQLRSAMHGNVYFMGGGFQFYLPGLMPGDLRVQTYGKL